MVAKSASRSKSRRHINWTEHDYAPVRKRFGTSKSLAERCIHFIETLHVPGGRLAGKRYRLHEYQREAIRRTVDADHDVSTVIWSAPRGWGKSGLLTGLGLAALFATEAADVILGSNGMRTARIPFDRMVRIIEMDPVLSLHTVIHRTPADAYIELPARGSRLTPLPADERYLVGQSPSSPVAAILVDEVGFVSLDTYGVLKTALGKGVDGSRLIGAGTPGLGPVDSDGEPNIMFSLRERAISADAPDSLVYIEHSAPPEDDPGDPRTWRKANPAIAAGLITERPIKDDFLTLPEHKFRLYRLGQWVASDEVYVRPEWWTALDHTPGMPPSHATLSLGFDGSSSTDATALVAMDTATGRLYVMGHWQPPGARHVGWRVPRQEVEDVIATTFESWNVAAMFCDPWLWRSELQRWQETWGEDRVQELDSSRVALMGPATDAFRAAARHGNISTDGNDALKSHALSARVKSTPGGDIVTKDARRPTRIDLLIAAVLAHEAGRKIEAPPSSFVV